MIQKTSKLALWGRPLMVIVFLLGNATIPVSSHTCSEQGTRVSFYSAASVCCPPAVETPPIEVEWKVPPCCSQENTLKKVEDPAVLSETSFFSTLFIFSVPSISFALGYTPVEVVSHPYWVSPPLRPSQMASLPIFYSALLN
jgi:hypothetical protein